MAIVSLLGRGEPPLDFNPLAMEHFYLNGISLIAVNEADPDLYPAGPRESSARPYRGHLLWLMAKGPSEPKRSGHPPAALHPDSRGIRDGVTA